MLTSFESRMIMSLTTENKNKQLFSTKMFMHGATLFNLIKDLEVPLMNNTEVVEDLNQFKAQQFSN
ncbi:hypothetical protein H5410_051908 [Solanum commersonii]|uniref:Uncharacterized protein n=1 Tax=Solanum commersonii TaxID=4109 RepID=A0A9J5WZD7_SOLCO|nr:hypothetical protein H5410_051908 [Solanum commersonii]